MLRSRGRDKQQQTERHSDMTGKTIGADDGSAGGAGDGEELRKNWREGENCECALNCKCCAAVKVSMAVRASAARLLQASKPGRNSWILFLLLFLNTNLSVRQIILVASQSVGPLTLSAQSELLLGLGKCR